jgi:FkbM family methyltransferase
MNPFKSLAAFYSYAAEYPKLPFDHSAIQFPKYLLSYVEGRLASHSEDGARARKFIVRLRRNYSIWLKPDQFGMAKGILEDREYSDLPLAAPAPQYILDLGANIGLSMLVLADQYPNAEIAGIEADPRNFPLLLQNLKANGLKSILMSAAIAGEQGLLNFRIGQNSTCSTLVTGESIHPGHSSSIEVPVLTMDQVLSHLGWPSIDLLKVDIEGAEESLFSGSPTWLEAVGSIVVEIHPNTTPEKIQSYLAPLGFILRRHTRGREPVYFASRE